MPRSGTSRARWPRQHYHHLLSWMVPVRRPKLSEVVVVLPFVADRPVLRPIPL